LTIQKRRFEHGKQANYLELRNLPDADEGRSQPESLYVQALEVAYHLVPGLEGLPEIAPGESVIAGAFINGIAG
jgi:hypothetical protein